MTDQELIALVQATPAEDLSLEQLDALRQSLLRSPSLREALVERLQMEQYLGHALGRIEVSVDRIFEQADALPRGNPTARLLYWGLAMTLLISSGIGWLAFTRDAAPKPIAKAEPQTPEVVPPETPPEAAEEKLTDAAAQRPEPMPLALPPAAPLQPGDAAAPQDEAWRLVIEAEDFSRGDVATDKKTWGRHIGIVKQSGNNSVFAEYDVEVPKAGPYRIELRYAAEEATPLALSINGALVKSGAGGEVTGGWGSDSQRWFGEGVYPLRKGKNVLRVASEASKKQRHYTFPSLDQLALISVDRTTAMSDAALAASVPWHEALVAAEPAPAFHDTCFEDFAPAESLRSAHLSAWLEQVPGQSLKIREQLPASIFDGFARLRSPWREDLALRLGLWDHHGLKIHFWNGREGVTLWYYQYPPSWVAYQTTRESNQPQPKTYALAAQDDQRFSRSSMGTFELRWADGRIWMTRGDMLLLSAALPRLPEEVYLEGHAGIRGISLVRSAGKPESPAQRRAVLLAERPAEQSWIKDLPEGALLNSLADGGLELAAEKAKSVSSIALPYPAKGFYEVVFQIEDPQPGSGIFLGDEQGRIEHKVAFLKDSRGGQTSLAFMSPTDKRIDSSEDINQRPASYALKQHWIKLILGCGTIKNLVSDDGVHYSRGDSPLQSPQGLRPCCTLGVYCLPGDAPRRIRVRRIEVREFPAMARLLPEELEAQALALTGDGTWTLGDWLANVIDNQPPDVDSAAWRQACAVKSLRAGPSTPLAVSILMGLLDEVLAESAPLAERLEMLEEVALVAPTWNYDSRQLATDLARRYETLGERLAWEGERKPYTAISQALLTSPISAATSIPTFPELLLRREVLNLVQAERWDEALEVCRRAEYWNRPAQPGQRVFARESIGALVEWTRAIASRHVAERARVAVTTMRGEWRHPLVEVLSKEGYNILAEFNAALDGEAYGDACQIISSADPQGALGLLPDAKDSRLLVSLPAAVSLAMREYPKLRQAMKEQFGARGQLRVRQAIGEGNLLALEAATMQFCGTEAAAEAHLWLGDRALAGGDFLHALGQYRQAQDGSLSPSAVQPRLRLAAAMLGREEGEPVKQTVKFNDLDLKSDEFEALVAEMLARTEGVGAAMMTLDDASAGEILAPRPAYYAPQKWAEFTGDLGRDPQQSEYPAIDSAGQQITTVVAEVDNQGLLLVNNRFQVVAYEVSTGKQRWATRLDKQQGHAHSWSRTPMQMVVAGGRVFTRRLSNKGPELACLNLSDGKLIWSVKPGDHVASDPLVAQDQLLAIVAAGTQDGYLQLSLASFDPRSGELLFQRSLAQLRDVWNRQIPCQATSVDDRIIASIGGGVLCCDLLGQVRWLRRQIWLPKALDDRWENQYVYPPLEVDGLVYLMQPGVRSVECLDSTTGRLRWQRAMPSIRRLCGVIDGKLIVETAEGLEAFDEQTGDVGWRRPAELLTGIAMGEPGGVLIAQNEQIDKESWRPTLVWLDPATGREIGRSPLTKLADKQPMLGPLVVHESRVWAFFGRGGREAAREIHELMRQGEPSPGAIADAPLGAWTTTPAGSLAFAAPAAAPGWTLLASQSDDNTKVFAERNKQPDVLVTLASEKRPARFVRLLDLPAGTRGKLVLKVGHEPDGKWGLDVRVGGDSLLSQTIDKSTSRDNWKELEVDLTPYAGRREWLTVLHRHMGDRSSYASWRRLEVLADPVPPSDPPHGGE